MGEADPFDLASPPHLQSVGVAAEVGGVDEAEAKDSDAAAAEGSDVAQSAVLQIGELGRLACRRGGVIDR